MAKALQFEFEGETIAFEMEKVDRSKLYGYKELEVIDEAGRPCELITLAEDGKTLIGKGGTGIGYLNADGDWCDKGELKAVNLEGDEIEPVPSSFAAPIPLGEVITIDHYLDHNVRLVYRLGSEAIPETLMTQLQAGEIFKFDYSYRGGLEADAGFLLMNDDDEIFFLVGDPTGVEFKNLQQAAAVAPADEATEEDEGGGLMDFGMI